MTIEPISAELEVEHEQKSFETSKMGIIYALIVLFGNGVHPILNNTRPVDLYAVIFSFFFSFWEFAVGLVYFSIYKMRRKADDEVKLVDFSIEPHKKWRAVGLLAIIGALFSVATFLYVRGLELAGSVSGSIALKTAPLYSILIGAIYLKEKVDYRLLLTIGAMITVLIYIGTAGTFQVEVFSRGFAYLLLVPFLWTIGHAIAKKLMNQKIINPLSIIVIRTGIVFIVLFIYALSTMGWQTVSYSLTNRDHILFSFVFGAIYFCMHLGWYRTIQILDLGYASAFVNPSPIITALLALVITKESIEPYHIVGLIVIIVALYMMIYFKSHPLKRKQSKKVDIL